MSREKSIFRPEWPEGLKEMTHYEVYCDDDGQRCGARMSVVVAGDGDVHVSMSAYHDEDRTPENLNPFPSIRIRTGIGGGRMTRTRQALLWLAKAIELDRKDNPEYADR